eukprot:CAMPEP_0176003096 /NCGR_PEP_ID=MMETSP0120_2-20121206/993_1 /TAXON_ID=160619 /ORGANISM="Kryptoperidinium foliaceum, Strain CCMP 1326" /LENGTH=220 /DNA_ID=CAMNT_0017335719 /DNA_START=899 /DNA_END=1558 /DNA_ORIENTATION=-
MEYRQTQSSPVHQNNIGAKHLRDGDHAIALKFFMQALEDIRSFGTREYPDEEEAGPLSASNGEDASSALHLWSDPFTLEDRVPAPVVTSSACLVFNAALIHHLQAIQTNSPNDISKAIQRYHAATKLYRQCIQLLENFQFLSTSEACYNQWLMYKIAVVNNLGLCYAELGMHQQSQRCFQELERILIFVLFGRVSVPGDDTEANLIARAKQFLPNAQSGA